MGRHPLEHGTRGGGRGPLGVLATLLVAGWLVAAAAVPAQATSLWGGASLFTDRKARYVGDLVTLIIVEQTEATQTASTRTGKAASVSLGPWTGIISGFPSFSGAYGDSFDAGGNTRRGGALRARMTAKVVEILPNGNLVIEGRQTIVVNAEEQELVVSGIVREADIQPDNTVLSTYMADARITLKGSGSLGRKQSPGILTTILDWLF